MEFIFLYFWSIFTKFATLDLGSRRWQRRFFILYDIGTLSWALDDNDGTEPAGKIDLNKPHTVEKAENAININNTISTFLKLKKCKISV